MEPMIRLGVEVKTGRPVEVPLSVLANHLWLQGKSGSGKTLAEKRIVSQIMVFDPRACIVVIDPGADQFMMNGLFEDAIPGRTSKFLSTGPDDAWNPIDIFKQFAPITCETIPLVTGFLATTWELDYGLGFGESFFSRANAAHLRTLLTELVTSGITHPTIEEFALALSAKAKGQKLRDTSEAEFVAHSLMNYGQLLPTDIPGIEIDVMESLERGDLIYGFLGAMTDPGAKILASILAWSFIYAAMQRYLKGRPPQRLYLVIDEFPLLAGSKQFGELFALCRKFGITIFAASQSSQQLRTKDQDLFPILWDNTATKIWFTPTDELDVRYLRSLSKDAVQTRGTSSTSIRSFQASSSYDEVYEPLLSRNEILDCAYTKMEGFLILNDGKSHHEPIRFRFEPDWSLDDYRRLSQTPLPKRRTPLVPPTSINEGGGPRKDSEYESRQAMLDALLQKKRQNENWKGN